jgi:hypothetical protein
MSPNIQQQVAENRRDVARLNGRFVAVPPRQGNNLNFSKNTIEVTVSLSVYTRQLNDSLISGHPDAKQGSGRGVSGDVRGSWSQANLTVQSVDFVRDGRNALRDALAGDSGALAEAGAGTGSGTVSDTDTAMAGETGRTSAYGLRATEADNDVRGRANFHFAEAGPTDQDKTEWALFGAGGQLLCRIITDALSADASQEVRADITLTFQGSAQSGSAFTDEGEKALADSMQKPSVAVGLDEWAWGTGTSAPAEGDTSLDTEVFRKTAGQTKDLEQIRVTATQFESEPSSQPHDYTEAGIFDNNGRLIYRVTFSPFSKDSTLRFTTQAAFRIV